jgi:hypothetical protein
MSDANNFTLEEDKLQNRKVTVVQVKGKPRKSHGCRCSETGCKKGYCSCFRNGVKCGPECGCKQCDNNTFKRFVACNTEDFWMLSLDYKFGKKIIKGKK